MEQQLQPYKEKYLDYLNGKLSRENFDFYFLKRDLGKFYNENKDELLTFLNLKTNGVDKIKEPNIDLKKSQIILEYFYFNMCPSLLSNPRKNGFISHYFMWVKEDDPNLLYIKPDGKPITNIKELLQNGLNVHIMSDAPIRHSAKRDELDNIKLFIENGANPTRGLLANVKGILIKGKNSNRSRDSRRLRREHSQRLESSQIVVKKFKSREGNLDIIKYLIENNADISILEEMDFQEANFDIKAYLKNLIPKPYKRINSTCTTDKLTDDIITEIGQNLGLTNSNKATLCNDIADYFQKAADYMKDNVNKCITESVLSGDAIGDVHPLFFTMYQQGNHMHCGDIRELTRVDKNPETRISFTQEQINTFKEKMNILTSFINNLDEEEEIVMSVSGLVKNAAFNFINLLRYPNPIDLYVNASDELIKNFILELQEMGILTNLDINSLDSVNI